LSSPLLEVNSRTLALEERAASQPLTQAISHVTGLTLLIPFVLLIHGYHPFADDAGIYVAGIRKMMDPSLFTVDAGFVAAHTRLSIFSHLFAGALQLFHIPLDLGLIAAYLLSIFAFLRGCFQLSQRLFADVQIQWGATLFASTLFTLPVAATALWIMDPYVTARSFSTPFSLFALTACMDRDWKRTTVWFLLTALMHPLMAAYLAAFLLTYIFVSAGRWRRLAATCILAFAGCAAIYFATRHAALPDGYREAALTREYFFLSLWRWYEVMGLIAPLLLMLIAAFRTRNHAIRNLCVACIATGSTACAVAACFIHTNGSFFLARIQPLRIFQLIYIAGVILLGGFLAKHLRGRRAALGAALLILVSSLMLLIQKQVYTTSAHVEWPFVAPSNPWQQAFLWIRNNTPQNAVFALDSNYTKLGIEDTQGFRATAARSALVDELKDGGVVAIFPQLAPRWKSQRDLEIGLNRISDQERIARLQPAGVTWLLLSAGATTQFACPYRNSAVAICMLPENDRVHRN
jgi:hypothetical protein